ncbi:disks large homolog 1-like [Ixodes scapularis]
MEAHRALELLEEYHSRLNKPQDKQLRNAIERVIRIFKSRLFQALLDIQEFYEITLLDDSKSIQQKTAETLQIACKWENSPPITGTHANSSNEKYRYQEEVDLPPTSSRLKDVDGLGTSVDHYSSSAVESPRKVGELFTDFGYSSWFWFGHEMEAPVSTHRVFRSKRASRSGARCRR